MGYVSPDVLNSLVYDYGLEEDFEEPDLKKVEMCTFTYSRDISSKNIGRKNRAIDEELKAPGIGQWETTMPLND